MRSYEELETQSLYWMNDHSVFGKIVGEDKWVVALVRGEWFKTLISFSSLQAVGSFGDKIMSMAEKEISRGKVTEVYLDPALESVLDNIIKSSEGE